MNKLIDLIKERFESWIRTRWIKMIFKEAERERKLKSKYERQAFVVRRLYDAYDKEFPED